MTWTGSPSIGPILLRIMSLLLGILIVAVCALFLIKSWIDRASFETADGQILSTYVSRIDDYHTPANNRAGGTYIRDRYVPHAEYVFSIGGETHSGDRIAYGIGDFASPGEAAAVLAPFRSRATVTVYYQAGDPESARLVLGYHTYLAWIFGGIGLALIALSRFLASMERHDAAAAEDGAEVVEEQSV